MQLSTRRTAAWLQPRGWRACARLLLSAWLIAAALARADDPRRAAHPHLPLPHAAPAKAPVAHPALPADPWQLFRTIWFDSIGVAEGLPHPTTTAIAQGSYRMIWIGTFGGLVRYDGYRMQVFGENGQGLHAMPDRYVRALAALPQGGLLVGTNNGGLLRFDPVGETFQRYPVGRDGLSSAKIFAIAPDGGPAGGGFWIATNDGLDHLDMASGRLREVFGTQDVPNGVSPRVFAVTEDRRGNVWIGVQSGLYERAAGETAFHRVTDADPQVEHILADSPWAVYEDREGRLWVGSLQSGVAMRAPDGSWHVPPELGGGSESLIHGRTVRDFMQADDGRMWIATDGAGVVIFDPASGYSRVLTHDPAMPSSLPGDTIRALFQDRGGVIWGATQQGVVHHDARPRVLSEMFFSPLASNTLAGPDVHSIYIDDRWRIWLGLGLGRIDVLDLAAGSLHHLRLPPSMDDRDVHAIVSLPDGAIAVGAEGIARIDPDTFAIRTGLVPALDHSFVLAMQREGDLLVVGTYDGVYRYRTDTGELLHLRHQDGDPYSLANDQVRNLAHLAGAWWYLTVDGISIDPDNSRHDHFRTLRSVPGDAASLPQNYVGWVTLDQRGRLWGGSYGGLAWTDDYRPDTPFRFQRIGAAQGLTNGKVNAVLVDGDDRAWASLADGLAMVDRAHAVHMFGLRDGLHITNYEHRSAAATPWGDLLFGGMYGLTIVHPQALPLKAAADAPLVATYVTVDQQPLSIGSLPAPGGKLTLAAGQHDLRVDFALLDYRALEQTRYSYRLEGENNKWIDVPRGEPPAALFTNLPYGDYILQLRAVTSGLDGHTITSSIRLEVPPRWFETATAKLALVLLGIFAIFGLTWLRTRYLRGRAEALQRQVDLRTRDLEQANARLDRLAGTDELTGVCNRRRFFELAEAMRRQAMEHSQAFCMLLIDLDEFKSINDTYGHLAGDEVIRAAVRTVLTQCRPPAVMGRYGGEELVLCLPDIDGDTAMRIAERIRGAVEALVVRYEDMSVRFTLSVGVASWRAPESLQAVLARADRALYTAKRSGRNRSVLADNLML